MGWGKFAVFVTLIWSAVAFAVSPTVEPLTTAPATRPAGKNAVVIHVDGQINDFTRDTLAKRMAEARKRGADTVILQIDTYGGAVTSGLEMSAMLKRATDLHTIAYVPEKAISAGTMIALAANEIVMGPSAKIGDAAPISIMPSGTMQPLPETERAKVESPILEDFRDSALRNGYEPMLTEAMVSVGRVVYWIENKTDGKRRFVNQADYDKLIAGDWKAVEGVRNPIDSASELLTVSTDLAVKLGLAKGTAEDVASLANQRGLTIIADLATGKGEEFLGLLNGPGVRGILFTIFLMSLYISLHTPGMGGAEAIAAAALGALVVVPMMTGYAAWWEVAAILLGLGLLALEIFVIPGFGFAGIAGVMLMMFGFLMTFVPKEPLPGLVPSLAATWSALQTGLAVIVAALIASLFLGMWLRKYMPKLPFFGRMMLSTPVGGTIDATAMTETAWPNIGDTGKAATDLRPGGSGQFLDPTTGDQRLVSVISDRGYVRVGTDVIVKEVGGGRVVVRPVDA